jgi:hypothetical protein
MQWEYCALCAWSVPLETWLCEVCTTLLANPAQTCVAEARVIVGQLRRALGEEALQARYQEAQQARREQVSAEVWAEFLQRDGWPWHRSWGASRDHR